MEDGRHFHICVDCMLPLDNFQLNLPPTIALDQEDCLPDFKLPSVGRLPPMACQCEDTWAQFGKLWRACPALMVPVEPTSWGWIAVSEFSFSLCPIWLTLFHYRASSWDSFPINHSHTILCCSLFPSEPDLKELVLEVVWGKRCWNEFWNSLIHWWTIGEDVATGGRWRGESPWHSVAEQLSRLPLTEYERKGIQWQVQFLRRWRSWRKK